MTDPEWRGANYLSIDVEDWFQVTNYAKAVSRSQWEEMDQRLSTNVRNLLRVLGEYDVTATFFVLGWAAERQADLVRLIAGNGHEIASHGYDHRPVCGLGEAGFREDLSKSLEILSKVVRSETIGFRAPDFSIDANSRWAFSVMAELGIRYDSSVYPIPWKRSAIGNAIHCPTEITTPAGVVTEFPIATWEVAGMRIPIGGGGYFRLYPYSLTAMGIRNLNRKAIPAVFYLHPWEIDPDQPVYPGVSWHRRWRHRVNLRKTETKLRRLLEEFRFQPLCRGLDPGKVNSDS